MINRRASRSSGKWSRRSARATKMRPRARSIWKAIEALAELIADNDEGEGCYGVMGTDSDDSDAFKLFKEMGLGGPRSGIGERDTRGSALQTPAAEFNDRGENEND
jgi:hypothetical protein